MTSARDLFLELGEGGYEVGGLDGHHEVAISSLDRVAPKLGDRFTVDGHGVVPEVAVIRLDTFQTGWNAVCRLTDVF